MPGPGEVVDPRRKLDAALHNSLTATVVRALSVRPRRLRALVLQGLYESARAAVGTISQAEPVAGNQFGPTKRDEIRISPLFPAILNFSTIGRELCNRAQMAPDVC